jgi:outer membrane protein assembly factor BamB
MSAAGGPSHFLPTRREERREDQGDRHTRRRKPGLADGERGRNAPSRGEDQALESLKSVTAHPELFVASDLLTRSTPSGPPRWTFAPHGGATTTALVAGNSVYVGSSIGTVFVLEAASGAVLWFENTGTAPSSRAARAFKTGGIYAFR